MWWREKSPSGWNQTLILILLTELPGSKYFIRIEANITILVSVFSQSFTVFWYEVEIWDLAMCLFCAEWFLGKHWLVPGAFYSCHYSLRQIGSTVPEVGSVPWAFGRIVSIHSVLHKLFNSVWCPPVFHYQMILSDLLNLQRFLSLTHLICTLLCILYCWTTVVCIVPSKVRWRPAVWWMLSNWRL